VHIAMSKGVAIMSMSLDGFIADLNDGVAEVFENPPGARSRLGVM
jgi:hypothetical protein